MKNISRLLLVASLVSALALPALAQTPVTRAEAPPPPPLPGEVNTNPQFAPVTLRTESDTIAMISQPPAVPTPAPTAPAIVAAVPIVPSAEAPAGTFFQSVESYFGSFDTNSTTFIGNKFDLWAGSDYVTGVNATSSLGIEYNINSLFSVATVTRNAGIAGSIVNEQIDVGISKVLFDTKFTAFIGAGYDFDLSRPYCALGARIKKALTTHTFAGISLETQIGGKRPSTPIVGVFTGFTF